MTTLSQKSRFYMSLAVCICSTAAADENSEPGGTPPAPDAFQQHTREAAAAYEVHVTTAPGQKDVATLLDQPILRWTNPLDLHQAHGDVFLWVARGRPAAASSIYQFTTATGGTGEHNEFCSLAESGLTAQNSAGRTWTPADPGVEFKPIDDAAAPVKNPKLRSRQMRELAERFTADKISRDDVQRALRLLSTPVYHLEPEGSEVLDGALFAFVEANDPEVFLLIEARSTTNGHEWQYAFTRMNSVQLRAFDRGRLVWEVPRLQWKEALNRADKTYTALTIRQP